MLGLDPAETATALRAAHLAKADLERAISGRRAVWLNPEPVARWNTGDSVIHLYARHVDVVVPCGSLAELTAAITEVARRRSPIRRR